MLLTDWWGSCWKNIIWYLIPVACAMQQVFSKGKKNLFFRIDFSFRVDIFLSFLLEYPFSSTYRHFFGISLYYAYITKQENYDNHTKYNQLLFQVAQNLFIVILFFCLLALFMQGVYKLLKTNGTSKYEVK